MMYRDSMIAPLLCALSRSLPRKRESMKAWVPALAGTSGESIEFRRDGSRSAARRWATSNGGSTTSPGM